MNDPVFLDSAAFLRVWQRVTGEAGITTAPEQPETDPLTAQLRECICSKWLPALPSMPHSRSACGAVRQPLGQIAAQKRAQLRALQTEYFLRTGALCALPRRLSAAEHGGGGSALHLLAGACAQRAAGCGSRCCADAAQRGAARHGTAGRAPRAARAHALTGLIF